ncbi:MAG: UDP-N-acetylglucosamine 1-carboxyvinyltransferase, partial [Bacteroidota bacterium]
MKSDSFEVVGGIRLKGDIVPQGAKNEALQILCATLLTDQKIQISNIPNILDVNRLIDLLRGLGVRIEQQSESVYTFQADQVRIDYFHSEEFRQNARKIRGSVMLIGPMLARFGKAFLPKPGGDKIGRRRLDTHFLGFKS